MPRLIAESPNVGDGITSVGLLSLGWREQLSVLTVNVSMSPGIHRRACWAWTFFIFASNALTTSKRSTTHRKFVRGLSGERKAAHSGDWMKNAF